ncbi:unnamed protein product [Chrysoparadoxa australica]
MEKFNNSIQFDKSMWSQDLLGSMAYAKGLARTGIITPDEAKGLVTGLEKVGKEWESGAFKIVPGDEDIHTANERRLTEIVGDVGKKVHTGRSRNDQVATDTRLWLRDQVAVAMDDLTTLIEVSCEAAEKHIDALMAGYTHLQPAQPVRFSHWLMSHVAALKRDCERLQDMIPRINTCPLGSGALAGHAFGIDRDFLKQEMKFQDITLNSMDAVCDRDFVAEYMWWASLMLTHLSQLSEDLIIMNYTKGVSLSDAYSTGSSLMPQKKNPDALELLRGKAGRIVGHLTGFLTVLKGLPRTYNKDLQEDKEPLFDTVDTVHDCLRIAAGVVATLTPNPASLSSNLVPEMLATDLAEYLVRKGVPFRETHHISGAAVKMAEDRGVPLNTLTPADLKTLHASFEDDVAAVWDYATSVERKDAPGGTSKSSVTWQIKRVRDYLASLSP